MQRESIVGAFVGAGFALVISAGISIALFKHQIEGDAGEYVRKMAFLLIYGPVIVGATVVSGIAGARKTLSSTLATSVGGMVLAAIPVALILIVFGSIGGLARFAKVEDFALQMLRDVAQTAGPLLVCPVAGALGYVCASWRRPDSDAGIDDVDIVSRPTIEEHTSPPREMNIPTFVVGILAALYGIGQLLGPVLFGGGVVNVSGILFTVGAFAVSWTCLRRAFRTRDGT